MSAQQAEPLPEAHRVLLVQYQPGAEAVARQLPEATRGVLRKAIGLLVHDPAPALSTALTADGTERTVQASQTLTLLYAVSGGCLIVKRIAYTPRVMRIVEDAPDQDAGEPQPGENAVGAGPEGEERPAGYRPFTIAPHPYGADPLERDDDETD